MGKLKPELDLNDVDFGSLTNIPMRLNESQKNDRPRDTNLVSFVYSSAIVLDTPPHPPSSWLQR